MPGLRLAGEKRSRARLEARSDARVSAPMMRSHTTVRRILRCKKAPPGALPPSALQKAHPCSTLCTPRKTYRSLGQLIRCTAGFEQESRTPEQEPNRALPDIRPVSDNASATFAQ